MKVLKQTFGRLANDEKGGEVLEYALILGLIVVVAIAVIGAVGTKVLARWTSVDSSMQRAVIEVKFDLLPMLPMLALLVWAAVEDLRSRRIRNWLTIALAASGLLGSFFGTQGITPSQSLMGLAIGFGVPFVLFVLGALRGGDVKLLAGIGAWIGVVPIIKVLIIEKLVGLLIVLIQCTLQGRLLALFRNSAVLVMNLAHVSELGTRHVSEVGQSFRSIDRPLPYAVPVLIAVVVVLTGLI